MAFADYSAYKTATACPSQKSDFFLAMTTSNRTGMLPNDQWARMAVPSAGATPSTAVAPTSATTGALDLVNGGTGRLVMSAAIANGNTGVASIIVCDRLSHQGGLSGTVTTAQTTNLPTAALTRYTSGVGVMAGLTIYTAVGATTTTFTVSYTNSAGTSGRTSLATRIGGSGAQNQSTFLSIPLAEGDVGVKSVESVTLAATTGTVGNFGVTLYKPLYVISMMARESQNLASIMGAGLNGGLEEIVDNACLFLMTCNTATPDINGALYLAEC